MGSLNQMSREITVRFIRLTTRPTAQNVHHAFFLDAVRIRVDVVLECSRTVATSLTDIPKPSIPKRRLLLVLVYLVANYVGLDCKLPFV